VSKHRLEAFSDGVIAILITIMVLELRPPEGTHWSALRPLLPVLSAYTLSFLFVGIYWNNHHHMLLVTDTINGAIMWANLHLLFWLSLVPFGTAWMGENGVAPVPTALYGAILVCAAIAYTILQTTIIRFQGERSKLAEAVRGDVKGKISMALYLSAIPLAFVRSWISVTIYFIVALIWIVPDPRIESRVRT
jgi:uncharacterized membrane protein